MRRFPSLVLLLCIAGSCSASRPHEPQPSRPSGLKSPSKLLQAFETLGESGTDGGDELSIAKLIRAAGMTQQAAVVRSRAAAVAGEAKSFILLESIYYPSGFDGEGRGFGLRPEGLRGTARSLDIEGRVALLLLYEGSDGLGYVTNIDPADRDSSQPPETLDGVYSGLWSSSLPDRPRNRPRTRNAYDRISGQFRELLGRARPPLDVSAKGRSQDGSFLVRVTFGNDDDLRSKVVVNPRYQPADVSGGAIYRLWEQIEQGPRLPLPAGSRRVTEEEGGRGDGQD